MIVTFYPGFSKKPNSTELPIAQSATQVITGEIKGDFSPLAPVIRFRTIPATTNPTLVYCYIASFKRYYFVSWAFVSGFWEASCTCDILGSYKNQILASSQYVERSESAFTGAVMDSAYFPTTNAETALAAVTQEQVWGAGYAQGVYVVGVVCGGQLSDVQKNIGAVRYYAMTQLGFGALMYALLNSPDWMNIDASEISKDLQKALINPAQYIVSAVWLPIDASTFIGTTSEFGNDITQEVRLGWWAFNIGTDCRILHDPTGLYDSWSRWLVIDYGQHPDTATFGRFVNFSPYTKVTLEFPPFGCIDLDTTDLNPAVHKISIHMFVHAYTGDAVAYIFNGDKEAYPATTQLIATLSANVGVQLPIGQIAVNVGNFKNAIVAGAVTGAAELANAVMEGS